MYLAPLVLSLACGETAVRGDSSPESGGSQDQDAGSNSTGGASSDAPGAGTTSPGDDSGTTNDCKEDCDIASSDQAAAQRAAEERVNTLKGSLVTKARTMGDCGEDLGCDILAVGSKPCGGPWLYVSFAAANAGAKELLADAETLEDIEDEYNLDYEILSGCDFLEAPVAVCIEMQCQLGG